MKTALVTTCYLNAGDYLEKTKKFIYYYQNLFKLEQDNIILLDNASSFENIKALNRNIIHNYGIAIQRFSEHFPRTSLLEYPYLWRAVYFFQEIFKEYDRILYCDNDAFLLSPKAIEWVNEFKEGWESPWCPRHNFPETGIQVLTNCMKYQQFINKFSNENDFIYVYNGQMMETTLPITINRDLVGDRHSESNLKEIPNSSDFSCQVTLDMGVKLRDSYKEKLKLAVEALSHYESAHYDNTGRPCTNDNTAAKALEAIGEVK